MSLALLLAAMLAPADETPRGFVERLYAGYSNPDYSPLDAPERVFAPPLAAAIREDWRLSRGEVGFMDADPLCQCQDPTGLGFVLGTVRRPWAGKAVVSVRLTLAGSDRRKAKLELVRTRAGWRIADIAAPDQPSLLDALRRFNRRRR